MEMLDGRVIKLRSRERIDIVGTGSFAVTGELANGLAMLTQTGHDQLHFVAPPGKARLVVRTHSDSLQRITIKSRDGGSQQISLDPPVMLFEFIVEPQPDEWYCENDDGMTPPTPHPVSKFDLHCRQCGGKVLRG